MRLSVDIDNSVRDVRAKEAFHAEAQSSQRIVVVQLRQNGWLFFVCHFRRPPSQTPNCREIRISGQASAERSVVPHWPGRRPNHVIIQPHFQGSGTRKSFRYPPVCDSRTIAERSATMNRRSYTEIGYTNSGTYVASTFLVRDHAAECWRCAGRNEFSSSHGRQTVGFPHSGECGYSPYQRLLVTALSF